MNLNQRSNIHKKVTIGFAILPAAAGSVITFMFVFVAIAGMIDILRKNISPQLNKYDRIVIYPTFAFFTVHALSIIRSDFKIEDLEALIPSLLFLTLYLVIKQYSTTGRAGHFTLFLKAVPFGAFLLLPWVIYEGIYMSARMEAGAGNAIPFAMICAMMIPICLINLSAERKIYQLVALVGFVIFALGLIYSQSRSMYVAVVPSILIALGYLLYVSQQKAKTILFSALFVLFGGLFALNSPTVVERLLSLTSSVASISTGTEIEDESVRHRVALLKKGVCFAQKKVIIGYGISNRDGILVSEDIQTESYFGFCNQNHGAFSYSHFHNGFLTAFIDAGIFGLLTTIAMLFAPLALAIVSPNDHIKPSRIAVALCLTSIYATAGLTNLLFGHDLIDAFFLTFTTFLALSVAETKEVSET